MKKRIILSLFILLCFIKFISGEDRYKFEHISVAEGLSQSTVYCILQDSKGFMWFGTQDGLNKYDGYGFKTYRFDPERKNSLSQNYVIKLCEDKDGIIWVGTFGRGLNKFDCENEEFTQFEFRSGDLSSLSNNSISVIFEDQSGTLWIGTNKGLNKFDKNSATFSRYIHIPDNPESLSSDIIISMGEDRSGVLYVGTSNGLNKYIPGKDTFVPCKLGSGISPGLVSSIYENNSGKLWVSVWGTGLYKFDQETENLILYKSKPDDQNGLSDNRIRTISEDANGFLWIGTLGGGLNRYDYKTDEFTYFRFKPKNPSGLSSDKIMSLNVDRSGILWIGTYDTGINKYDPNKEKFKLYRSDPYNTNSLSINSVSSISRSSSGELWIGTDTDGLNKYDPQKEKFIHYREKNPASKWPSSDRIRSVYEDSSGVLWIGNALTGLDRYDLKTGQYKNYKATPGDPSSLKSNTIRVIFEDSKGVIWIGTFGGGIYKYNRDTDNFSNYNSTPEISYPFSTIIQCIYEDRAGILWIGTGGGGLRKLDRVTKKFTNYRNDLSDPTSISSDVVFTIFQDDNGIIWLGTYGGGLNRFDPDKGIFTHYNTKHGLPNDIVYAILEDKSGYLWLSTNRGLSRFDPKTEVFYNYTPGDGLQSYEFSLGAYCQMENGEMFFGGVNGINSFFPDKVYENKYIPPIVITGFQIFNKTVSLGEDSPLKKHISETNEINLSYDQNIFSFNFVALNYTIPEKNQYKYIMEGFENEWNYTNSSKRYATYTNLDPGEYKFRVTGSNNDGIWNEEGTSIIINIIPPFWMTWWFRSILVLIILFLTYFLYKRRVGNIEAKKRDLEIRVHEKTTAADALNKALSEVEVLKDRLQAENIYLQDEIKLAHNFSNIITCSESMEKILRQVEQVGATDSIVLVLGESGTGKELLARAIHKISKRKERPLVKVDCASLPPTLIESELFGHEKGAFTGAISKKTGRFELADGGTIFLDEIGELPTELQPKLLRFLQDGEFERLGNSKTLKVDIRVIAATNRDLEDDVREGVFREDLFYRLNVFPITIPPLRDRKEDLPLLVKHFTEKYSKKSGKKIDQISQNLITTLNSYHWPGNIRELENIIERAVIISHSGKLILGNWFSRSESNGNGSKLPTLEESERDLILKALEKTNWRVSGENGAAKIVGINSNTMVSRMKKLGISRKP